MQGRPPRGHEGLDDKPADSTSAGKCTRRLSYDPSCDPTNEMLYEPLYGILSCGVLRRMSSGTLLGTAC